METSYVIYWTDDRGNMASFRTYESLEAAKRIARMLHNETGRLVEVGHDMGGGEIKIVWEVYNERY